ncbi:hypothetical protein BHM03_00012432 [Ensete ventricosum]|uniref:Uncharacterized protein n=1 Tax=Ensete ventricosum TaxID=4639 RepID=A0A445MDP7_ENSVE|nr:hypothetical protein BHM03_00012432 [Ensete ventricosum]
MAVELQICVAVQIGEAANITKQFREHLVDSGEGVKIVKAEDGSSGFCTRGKHSCVDLETAVVRLGQLRVAVDPTSAASAGRQQ